MTTEQQSPFNHEDHEMLLKVWKKPVVKFWSNFHLIRFGKKMTASITVSQLWTLMACGTYLYTCIVSFLCFPFQPASTSTENKNVENGSLYMTFRNGYGNLRRASSKRRIPSTGLGSTSQLKSYQLRLVSDTTKHLQSSFSVHDLTGQSCFGSIRGAY